MRYIIRLVIPALVFAGAVYVLTRRPRRDGTDDRGAQPGSGSDTAAFITILIVSGLVALGTAYLLESLWEHP